MRDRVCVGFTILVAAILPAGAVSQTRRADITGGGGNGKCTIEVEVDGSATVEIEGGVGYLRTTGGQPATWRRFQCNQVMPPRPVNFRFRGIDGRGSQQLVSAPGYRGSRAVIRIDDPRGGREGYTFDIEWQGSGDNSGGGGPNPGGPGGPGGGRPGGGYGGRPISNVEMQRACSDAVYANLSGQGFRNTSVTAIRQAGPGAFEGEAVVSRGIFRYPYAFSCRADSYSGRILSLNVSRR